MAAALAASLPAPQATPTPAAPTHEIIPASMSKAIDLEAETPLTAVQLDGMVSAVSPLTLITFEVHVACTACVLRLYPKLSSTARNHILRSHMVFYLALTWTGF